MEVVALDTAAKPHPGSADNLVGQLLDLGAPAYRLAFHVLGSSDGAEDAVQQAYLEALAQIRSGSLPDDARSWFLGAVANKARNHLKTEARHRRKGAALGAYQQAATPKQQPDEELISGLRQALAELEEKYRLPLVLSYEESLSCREVAAVLGIPERTVSNHVSVALEQLRKALARAGYAAAPAAVIGGLAHTAPPVPATLAAAIEGILTGKATGTAATAAAAAKGGITMKVIVGIVAAGVLAGAAAGGLSAFGSRLSAPPPTANSLPPTGLPAPVNEYKGMQEREEVFEFTQKPAVAKEGDKWVITFASKGKCDATVSIVDKDGKIIRHLASGVLGVNAPYPFQQNSLAQKLEWDGQTDDFKKAPAGCKVKVGLGLKAEFERNIAFDHYDTYQAKMLSGTAADGNTCLATSWEYGTLVGVYDKDGKYLRTAFPPPAAKVEKFMASRGYGLATTDWGDKTLVCSWFGPFIGHNTGRAAGKTTEEQLGDAVAAMRELEGVKEIKELEKSSRPAGLQAEKFPRPKDPRVFGPVGNAVHTKLPRLFVDRGREQVYSLGGCFDGKTGELVNTPVPTTMEMAVGHDGLVYIRTGGHCSGGMVRLDQDGKAVPFPKGVQFAPPRQGAWDWGFYGQWAAKNPGIKLLVHAGLGQSATWQCGFDTAPNGDFLAVISSSHAADLEEYAKAATENLDCRVWKGAQPNLKGVFVTVWNKDGEILTRRAIEGPTFGSGAHMDREGNLYIAQGAVHPPGMKDRWDGIKEAKAGKSWGGFRQWGSGKGSIIKFRGQGGKYPIGKLYGKSGQPAAEGAPPADALKLEGYRTAAEGALWAYGGISGVQPDDCGCSHHRWDLDDWARSWVPAVQLCSVMVLDANGNRIARIGRYGNIDDADPKYGKVHFAWMRAAAASDTALYVADTGNRRIVKATLSYAAEEAVPLP